MDFKFGVLLVISAYICTSQALPPCTCPTNYAPVCGNDGHTHLNQCQLDCIKYRFKKDITIVPCFGPLPLIDDCVCNLDYNPVCGNDGQTYYPNQCSLECKKKRIPGLEMSHTGACEDTVKVADDNKF